MALVNTCIFVVLSLLLVGAFGRPVDFDGNMNGDYVIANPDPRSKIQFSTDYTTKNASYFEVYSLPVRTVYGQVYWTVQDPQPLPQSIVDEFSTSTMAVIGYEIDQVFRTANGDVSVPIYWSYNHHYEIWLLATSKRTTTPHSMKRGDLWYDPVIPTEQFFSEGNGGEFRKSYHGYPTGYAQLIYSPKYVQFEPMQIDTHNRDYNGKGYKAGPLPRSNLAPPDATYSGLLECPCTTRINKTITVVYNTIVSGTCGTPITNATECFSAVTSIGIHNDYQKVISDDTIPSGCSVYNDGNSTTAMFNTNANSVNCGGGDLVSGTNANSLVKISLTLDGRSGAQNQVLISMTGPVGVWFGVGFNASAMADAPYAIVIDGDGNPTEHKIGDHNPGKTLTPQVKVLSSTVSGNLRTVVLTRPLKGLTPDHYTFDLTKLSIPFINAIGSTPQLSYHKVKASSNLALTVSDGITCVCNGGVHGYINGVAFGNKCAPEPIGDLLQQNNPTCFIQTYAGGKSCCRHQTILLDADQPVDNRVDELYLKVRFYYQKYVPPTSPPALPSHLNLHRFYFATEAWATEYDILPCPSGTPPQQCVQVMTSHFKVRDMLDCDPVKNPSKCTVGKNGVQLIYAGGHCHAPSCISMELYNADTGQLLCEQVPLFGTGDVTDKFDELGYAKGIPPCLWSDRVQEGLVLPTTLYLDTNLMSVKRNNNTIGHYGEMAHWQMRGVFL